jgi:MAF protein
MKMLPIILGSSSVFRQQQLQKLGLPFTVAKPDFDETPQIHESAHDTALRLAIGKAQSLAQKFPNHLIIGADQVAFCQNKQLGKPMSVVKAQQMLLSLSHQRIDFYSAVVLLNTSTGTLHQYVDETQVKMRALTEAQIKNYLEKEPDAIFCAGAAKSEGLGAALLESIHSSDPNALIGLPIFALINFLQTEGIAIL